VVEDITDLKKAEEALQASEMHLREVLENSLDVSYNRNLTTNTYDYLSPVLIQISGYTVEEMNNFSLEARMGLIHPDDLAKHEDTVLKSMSSPEGSIHQVEYRFKHKNGNYHWFHDQFTILRGEHGNNIAIIGSLSDITERKQTEENLQKSKEELQRRQRMDALATLAGGISHDFNNIITAIRVKVELLLLSQSLTPTQKKDCESILDAIDRATKLTEQLQHLSRNTSSQKTTVDIYKIAHEVLDLLDRTTDKIIVKKLDLQADEFFVTADASRIHQVLLNLGTNAIKAIEEKGSSGADFISISAEKYISNGSD